MMGRPPAMSIQHTDCRFPDENTRSIKTGNGIAPPVSDCMIYIPISSSLSCLTSSQIINGNFTFLQNAFQSSHNIVSTSDNLPSVRHWKLIEWFERSPHLFCHLFLMMKPSYRGRRILGRRFSKHWVHVFVNQVSQTGLHDDQALMGYQVSYICIKLFSHQS